MDVIIPGYKLVSEIGKGGMATVYVALQENFNRKVALKIMASHLTGSPVFGERFLREARIIASLNHRNIVPVYDVGRQNGCHYLSMEYLPGGDLKARLRGGLRTDEALVVVYEIACALAYAHSKSYIHRDIKPENILFREDDTVVLTDFGIAKALDGSDGNMTSTGMIVGSPHYMSPEQALARKVDARSDIYSLGVVFYEVLVGHPLYSADSSVAAAIKHVSEPIPKLPATLSSLQPILEKMVAKSPEDRFQAAEEVAQALAPYMQTASGSWKTVVMHEFESETDGGTRILAAAHMSAESPPLDTTITSTDNHPARPWFSRLMVGVSQFKMTLGNKLSELWLASGRKKQMGVVLGLCVAGGLILTIDNIATSTTQNDSNSALSVNDNVELHKSSVQPEQFAGKEVVAAKVVEAQVDDFPVEDSVKAAPELPLSSHDDSTVTTADTTADIAQLLDAGREALRRNRLMFPEEGSAYTIFLRVLKLDPDQQEARNGLVNVVNRYMDLASQALNAGDLGKAQEFLDRADDIAELEYVAVEHKNKVAKMQGTLARLQYLELMQQLETWLAVLQQKEDLSIEDMNEAYATYMKVQELNLESAKRQQVNQVYSEAFFALGKQYFKNDRLDVSRELVAKGLMINPEHKNLQDLDARWRRKQSGNEFFMDRFY